MKESAPEIHHCLPQGRLEARGSGGSSAPEARSLAGSGRSDGGACSASEPGLLKWLIREQWAQAEVANKAVRAPPPPPSPQTLPARRPPPPALWGRGAAGAGFPRLPGEGRIPRDNKGARAAMTFNSAGDRGSAPGPPHHQTPGLRRRDQGQSLLGSPAARPARWSTPCQGPSRASHVSGSGGGQQAGEERGRPARPLPRTSVRSQDGHVNAEAAVQHAGPHGARQIPAAKFDRAAAPHGHRLPVPRGVRPGLGRTLSPSECRLPAPRRAPLEPAADPQLALPPPPQLPQHLSPAARRRGKRLPRVAQLGDPSLDSGELGMKH